MTLEQAVTATVVDLLSGGTKFSARLVSRSLGADRFIVQRLLDRLERDGLIRSKEWSGSKTNRLPTRVYFKGRRWE